MSGRKYSPRRAGARWREGAPSYILDCFDHPQFADRYTVIFALVENSPRGPWLHYLGIGYGASAWGELDRFEAAAYRYANGKKRIRWLDIPEDIRKTICARWEAE
jgi:hypothetical protein